MLFHVSAYDILEMILSETLNNPEDTVKSMWNIINEIEKDKLNFNSETIQLFKKIYLEELVESIEFNYFEVKEYIQDNKKDYINNLKDELIEYCQEEGVCTNCGSTLYGCEFDDYRGEYLGFDSYESINEYFCPYGCIQQNS